VVSTFRYKLKGTGPYWAGNVQDKPPIRMVSRDKKGSRTRDMGQYARLLEAHLEEHLQLPLGLDTEGFAVMAFHPSVENGLARWSNVLVREWIRESHDVTGRRC
jgi:hypothetical protein